VARGWRLKLIRPVNAVEIAVNKAWALALQDLERWMKDELIEALVTGGFGIQGIQDTAFYRFISSPDGLSQLGIEKSDPLKLLEAYRRTFKVSRNNRLIMLKFGDVARLKLSTPHPYAGIGHLHVRSWLEFIVDGVQAESGFVPRGRLPRGAQNRIRVNSAPGGLMLPRGILGSKGKWRVPKIHTDYDVRWLKRNTPKIEKAIQKAIVRFLNQRLS
jgi:hypothetical protein